jgi:hypothetical protein
MTQATQAIAGATFTAVPVLDAGGDVTWTPTNWDDGESIWDEGSTAWDE